MKRATSFVCGLLTGLVLAIAIPRGQAHDADTLANSAPQKNPLFLNMTSGDSWRGWMGLPGYTQGFIFADNARTLTW